MKVKSESEVTQLCPTFRDPVDCSLPRSSVYGIFQARVLEWGAIAFFYFTLEGRRRQNIHIGQCFTVEIFVFLIFSSYINKINKSKIKFRYMSNIIKMSFQNAINITLGMRHFGFFSTKSPNILSW